MLRFIKTATASSPGLFSSLIYCNLRRSRFAASATFHGLKCLSTRSGSSKNQSTDEQIKSQFTQLPIEDLALGYKPRLADRPYIPGSTAGDFPEFLSGPKDGESFPMAYSVKRPEDFDIQGWSGVCRQLIDTGLPEWGALLIRNLPLRTLEDFKNFLKGLDYRFFGHGVTGYRTPLGEHVYTASDDPPEYTMEPHNEASYNTVYPKKVILFCITEPAPQCGGETALLKNRDLTAMLDPNIVRKFEEKQIRYQAYLPNRAKEMSGLQKSWQDRFWVEDPKEAEKVIESFGWEFSWDEHKNLRYWYNNTPVIHHPVTGEKIWFNQLASGHASYFRAHPGYENVNIPDDNFPFHSYYGDGSEIEPAVLQHIRVAMWSCAVGLRWRSSDVAVLDNLQVLHGRMGWTGERKLVTSLIDE